MKRYIFTVLLIFFMNAIFAQTPQIFGKVTDSKTNEPLPGAIVIISNSNFTLAASTDVDGNYSFSKLADGTYDLKCSFVSFNNYIIQNIKITSKSNVNYNISMSASAQDIAEVIVSANAVKNTENAILVTQKNSITLLNGISSENLLRLGASDLADAAKSITGVSVEDGKYIFVRGLSDRYTKVTINATSIPNLDPNKNTIQLDLFSTNIIENIMIQKTYSANLPGNFAGGYVDISTKSFPNNLTLQISASVGYNPQANLINNFLIAPAGKTDWLCIDNRTRQIPQDAQKYIPYLYEDNNLLDKITTSFNKNMSPIYKKSGINQSYTFSFGNNYNFAGKKLGVIADFSYSTDYKYYKNGTYSLYNLLESDNYKLMNPTALYTEEYGQQEVTISSLLGLSMMLNKNNKMSLNFIEAANGNNSARIRQGSDINDNLFVVQNTLGYQQRSFFSGQINGSHLIKNTKLKWSTSVTKANLNEPDLRFFFYDYDSLGNYHISYSAYPAPARFYRYMKEWTIETKADLVVNQPKNTIKYGFAQTTNLQSSISRKFDILSQGLNFNGNINQYLSNQNIGQNAQNASYGVYYQDDTITDDFNSFKASEYQATAYFLIEKNLSQKFSFQAGLRYEFSYTNIYNLIQSYHPKYVNATQIYYFDFLPSLNINYNLSKTSNMRFAASRTLARPSFKEIAPYAYYDFKEGWRVVGNPELKRSIIYNFDYRFEHFFDNYQMFSISTFVKYFNQPIELVDDPRANNPEFHYVNVDNSFLYGLEIEIRKNLDFLNAKNLMFGSNFTYIYSQVKYVENYGGTTTDIQTRPMYGQAPWIVNTFVNYDINKIKLQTTLSFNIEGPKLSLVTKGNTPDVYSNPFASFNYMISKTFGRIVTKLAVNNILNYHEKKTYTFENQQYTFQDYSEGQTFSCTIKYLFY